MCHDWLSNRSNILKPDKNAPLGILIAGVAEIYCTDSYREVEGVICPRISNYLWCKLHVIYQPYAANSRSYKGYHLFVGVIIAELCKTICIGQHNVFR